MKEVLISEDIFAGANFTSHLEYENDIWLNVKNTWYMISDILSFLICLANIAANIFLIFTILRFKRLRTRSNFYLVNIAMTNTAYHTVAPVFSMIIELTGYHLKHRVKILCFISFIEESACFTMYCMATMLALDWFISSFQGNFLQKHKTIYKHLILITYLICAFRYAILVDQSCVNKKKNVDQLLYISYVFSIAAILMLNIYRMSQRSLTEIQSSKKVLIVSNLVILAWIPLIVYNIISMLGIGTYITRRALSCTRIIPEILAYGNTIILLYVLGRVSSDFKTAYGIAFKKNIEEYDLDDSENSVDDDSLMEEQQYVITEEDEPMNKEATRMLLY